MIDNSGNSFEAGITLTNKYGDIEVKKDAWKTDQTELIYQVDIDSEDFESSLRQEIQDLSTP